MISCNESSLNYTWLNPTQNVVAKPCQPYRILGLTYSNKKFQIISDLKLLYLLPGLLHRCLLIAPVLFLIWLLLDYILTSLTKDLLKLAAKDLRLQQVSHFGTNTTQLWHFISQNISTRSHFQGRHKLVKTACREASGEQTFQVLIYFMHFWIV